MQGSFVKKRGNTWSAYFYVSDGEGERRQRSKGGFATKGDAQDYLQKTMHTVHTGEYVEPARLTLAEYLLDRWLPSIETSVRPSTFDSYTRQLKLHVIPHLGRVQLQQLSVDDLDRLYAELLKTRAGGRQGRAISQDHPLCPHHLAQGASRRCPQAAAGAERGRCIWPATNATIR